MTKYIKIRIIEILRSEKIVIHPFVDGDPSVDLVESDDFIFCLPQTPVSEEMDMLRYEGITKETRVWTVLRSNFHS